VRLFFWLNPFFHGLEAKQKNMLDSSDTSDSCSDNAKRPRKGVVQDHLRVKYKLTLEDISHYVYCGSDKDPLYFQRVFGGRIRRPSPEMKCVCETPIHYNFYIRDSRKPASETETRDLEVIGSCCIKQFTNTAQNTGMSNMQRQRSV
jgi:hypothetical protein